MTVKNSLILGLLFLVLTSCDKHRVFDRYIAVDNAWHRDSIIRFDFETQDTVTYHQLFVTLRNNKNYPFSNLFVIISMEDPDEKITVDTLEYMMAYPDGTLMGKGFSDIKENKLFYKENFRFKKPGKYQMGIQHAVRDIGQVEGKEILNGVQEVGFRIESKK
ncbi:MAG: gliding motility lipoprotein GldH [Flavobacterium sp.]